MTPLHCLRFTLTVPHCSLQIGKVSEQGDQLPEKLTAGIFISTPDMQHKIIDIIAADSAAMMEYYFEGTLLHPEKNTTGYMLGKKYKLAACTVMNIRKGEIISQQTYFDQVSFLRQVGFFDQQ